MTDPYLDSGESFIVTTHRISAGFDLYDMMLTTRHLVLVDSSAARFEPEKIPLSAIVSVNAGRVVTGEPVITLGLTGGDRHGAGPRQLRLLFTQQPGENRRPERDVWIRQLMDQIVAVRQCEAPAAAPEPAGPDRELTPAAVAPPRTIDAALPHTSVVITEPEYVELDVVPEEPSAPADLAAGGEPAAGGPSEGAPGGTTPPAQEHSGDAAGTRPPGSPGEPPEDRSGLPPVLPAVPAPEPEAPASPDPFAAAVEAIRASAAASPVPAMPGAVTAAAPPAEILLPDGDRKPSLFGRVMRSIRSFRGTGGAGGPADPEDAGSYVGGPPEPEPDDAAVPDPAAILPPAEELSLPGPGDREPSSGPAPDNAGQGPEEPVPAGDGMAGRAAVPEGQPAEEGGAPAGLPPQSPRPFPGIPGAALAAAILLATIVGVLLLASLIGVAPQPSPAGVPLSPAPEASPSPTSPPATLPPAGPSEGTVPASGVWVTVAYPGRFTGYVGNPGSLEHIRGTGSGLYRISDTGGLVQASVAKQDYSGALLVVSVYRNGREVYNRTVSAPMGALDFIIDPVTGGFPGGIPEQTSATGLVPGQMYLY